MTLRQLARIAGFAGVTAGMLPVFVAHERLSSEDERERVRERWVAAWAGTLLAMFGVSETVVREAPEKWRAAKPPRNGAGAREARGGESQVDSGHSAAAEGDRRTDGEQG